jgi:hypothetical protein
MAIYLAVRCHDNSEHIIALCLFEQDSFGPPQASAVSPFVAVCSECKKRQWFDGHEVIVWQGPQPGENFMVHPAFQ